jgi:hypothetical protein
VNNGFGNKKQEDLGRFLSKNNNDNNGFFWASRIMNYMNLNNITVLF